MRKPKAYKAKRDTIKFSDNLNIVINRQYKQINPARILDLAKTDIKPIVINEMFVRLIEYKDAWISNHGRLIVYKDKSYTLQKPITPDTDLKYCASKLIYIDGRWKYNKVFLYAAKTVVQQLIINPDIKDNNFIWHKGYNKADNYYKN